MINFYERKTKKTARNIVFVTFWKIAGRETGKKKGIFWSTVAGYTSFLIHAGGPPLNFYLLPQKMHKTIYVSTFTLAFAIINAVKLITYYFLGQLAPSYMVISLILLPLAPVGIIIGYYLHKKVSEKIFYKFIYFFLAIGGFKLIYDGIF